MKKSLDEADVMERARKICKELQELRAAIAHEARVAAIEDVIAYHKSHAGTSTWNSDLPIRLRALASATPQSEWRDIASAPKGENDIIDVWQIVTQEEEKIQERRFADAVWDGGAWVQNDTGEILGWKDEYRRIAVVTHWRPRPAPPQSEGGVG